MKKKLIEFKNVSFRYAEDKPWVLKNVSFNVSSNEWVAIIGHNGSGKSTIAKLMNGLLFATEGEILINGKAVKDETIWDIRDDVGMVFQNPENQFVGTTVQDDVAFGMENRGFPRELMIERIDSTLKAVGMIDHLMSEPSRLSGGQKQRVAIAAVLAISPKILILDEATAMLDPLGRAEIMRTVTDIQKVNELSLITITHNLGEITQANRVIVINEGEVWGEGTPREIFAKGADLRKIGLDVPFVTSITESLKVRGISFPEEPLNQEELLAGLWKLHLKT